MRVLVLIPDAFGGRGGIAKYNRDLLTSLCSHPALDEVVAIPRNLPEPVGELPGRLEFITDGAGGKIDFIRAAWNAAERGPFDLILCGHINLLPLAWALKWRMGSRVALIMHGIEAWKSPASRIKRELVRWTDAFVCVSQLTRERFKAWSGVPDGRIFQLPNCVEAERFGPGRKPVALLRQLGLTGRKVLLTLGRMDAAERYKGFDEVLELLPELAKEVPNIAYVCAGDGTDRARLEHKARALGVADRVVFTGHVGEELKADLYRAADAYVMPGRGEGFGIVYLEALACGIPVVASTLDGSREAVRGGMLGTLVDPRDPQDIKRGILTALRQRRGTVPTGLEYFSFANYERRCHLLVERLLGVSRDPELQPVPVLRAVG